jgi:peptidoglycan/LPS O-acetylase OafA/YrhL
VRASAGHQNGAGDRLRVLDALRFLAAMAVVFFHFTGRDSLAWGESVRQVFPTLSRVTLYGGFGPYLFFMISGFVVLMSAWGRRVPAFLASRVGRLYPAYWVAVVLIAVVLVLNRELIGTWNALGPHGVALNLTMFQSAFGVGHVDGVFWTLWVELKFYALLVIMIMVGITRARMMALCLVWPVLAWLAAQSDAALLAQLLEPAYAPFFCIGILTYLVHRYGWTVSAGLLLAFNVCLGLWVSSTHYVSWSLTVAGSAVSVRGIVGLFLLCVAALLVATLTPVRRLDWRWLTVLGALTYPLYLLHEIPGWVLIRSLGPIVPAYVAVAVAVLLALVAAWLVHRFVERPLGAHLRRAIERDLSRLAVPDQAFIRQEASGVAVPGPRLPSPGSRHPAESSADVPVPVLAGR